MTDIINISNENKVKVLDRAIWYLRRRMDVYMCNALFRALFEMDFCPVKNVLLAHKTYPEREVFPELLTFSNYKSWENTNHLPSCSGDSTSWEYVLLNGRSIQVICANGQLTKDAHLVKAAVLIELKKLYMK